MCVPSNGQVEQGGVDKECGAEGQSLRISSTGEGASAPELSRHAQRRRAFRTGTGSSWMTPDEPINLVLPRFSHELPVPMAEPRAVSRGHPLGDPSQTSTPMASHSTTCWVCFNVKAMVFLSQVFD